MPGADFPTLRERQDAVLHDSLPYLAWVLAAVYLGAAVNVLILHPWRQGLTLAFLALATAGAMTALGVALHRGRVAPQASHAIAAAIAAAVMLNVLTRVRVEGSLDSTAPHMLLLIVGVGAFVTSPRWFAGTMIAIFTGWLAAERLAPATASGSRHLFSLLGAAALAVLIHGIRVRAFARLHELLGRDAQRAADLERALAVAETARREAEAASRDLERTATLAQQAAEAKSQFLATVSHEIRTPMNGVIGMTDLLLGTDLNPEQREYAGVIHKSGKALLVIIDDILDFSRLEARRLRLKPVPFDPRSLLADATQMVAEAARGKGLELMTWVEEGVPSLVVGDPTRIQQVLTNLLDNATKFTETGGIEARIRKLAVPGRRARLRFEVVDTGIGIAAENLPLLFQAFSQVDSSSTRKYGGTGLGLAISQQLVQLMGSEIEVSSRPGAGSTFAFTLTLGVARTAVEDVMLSAQTPRRRRQRG